MSFRRRRNLRKKLDKDRTLVTELLTEISPFSRNDKQYVLEYKNQLPPALARGFYLNSKKALAELVSLAKAFFFAYILTSS